MKPLRIIVLTLLAISTWWLAFTQEPKPVEKAAKPGHKIDYFVLLVKYEFPLFVK